MEFVLLVLLGYSIAWCLDNLDKVKEIWAVITRAK